MSNYSFATKKSGILRTFFNDIMEDPAKNIAGVISFWETINGKHVERNRSVRIDENGKRFFTWNKERINFDDFLAFSPSELVEKINRGEASGDDLCHTLEKYGLDSLRISIRTKKLERINFGLFSMGFSVRSNLDKPEDFDWVDYEFVPEYLRMPKDNYKLKLMPLLEEHRGVYPSEDFYVGDLVGLLSPRSHCKDYSIKVSEEVMA